MAVSYDNLIFSILSDRDDVSGFHCGEPDLDEFLKEDALCSQSEHLSVTRLVYYANHYHDFASKPV